MSGRLFTLAITGMLAISYSTLAQEGAVVCTSEISGTVIVPLMCEAARPMLLGDNMQRGTNRVVDGTNGTQTAGFKIIGDDEDWVKIVSGSASLSFDLTPTQDGEIPSTAPSQTTTLNPVAGSLRYWTGSGSNVNTAVQTSTVVGAPHGLDWNESPGNGSRFFYVGATFNPAADQQRGRYEGTVQLTVSYY